MPGTKRKTKSSRGMKENDSSSSSSQNKSGVALDSSQCVALQRLKKKSIAARSKTGSGWVRPTGEERKVLKGIAEKMKRGRPPKEVRREVVSIRLTADEATRIRNAAIKAKMPWTEFIRNGALEACEHV